MGYTKDGSNARAKEKEPCGQHSFSHWVLIKLHMIWDTKKDRSKQSTNGYICPPPLSSLPFLAGPHQQAQIVENGILYYDKASHKVIEKVEDHG